MPARRDPPIVPFRLVGPNGQVVERAPGVPLEVLFNRINQLWREAGAPEGDVFALHMLALVRVGLVCGLTPAEIAEATRRLALNEQAVMREVERRTRAAQKKGDGHGPAG